VTRYNNNDDDKNNNNNNNQGSAASIMTWLRARWFLKARGVLSVRYEMNLHSLEEIINISPNSGGIGTAWVGGRMPPPPNICCT
jgi:hypothetical protein